MNQNDVTQALNCSVSGQNIQNYSYTTGTNNALYKYQQYEQPNTLWGYWQGIYYPQVILQSYPVYIQEKAMDKGKQAFELLKALMDKGLVKIDKVKDFIEAMDTILKTL